MARVDLAQENLRLNTLYAAMSDEELLELMNDLDDLTDLARNALTAQIAARGIKSPTPGRTQNAPISNPPGKAASPYGFEDLTLGGVTVAECETSDEAGLLSFVLGEAGIRSVVRATEGKFDTTLPRVRVAPEDAERAATVLANPIPDSVRREYAEMSYDNASFTDLRCPRCNSAEIMLQPENPAYLNDWLCSRCGYNWQDCLPDEMRVEEL
jgi:ribosomal protein S27AE